MKIRSYTTIQLKDLTNSESYGTTQEALEDLITEYNIEYEYPDDVYEILNDLWTKLNNRYANYCIFEVATDDASQEVIQAKMRDWLCKFINEYQNTREYYEYLIYEMIQVRAKLMADIEASNENEVIFNDTPQTTGGVFKSTDYATTYTKTTSKSKTPMKTPIERLKDVQDNLRNLWKDWLDKFHELFIEVQEGGLFYEI